MKYFSLLAAIAASLAGSTLGAAEKLSVTATNPLALARPAETISVPWAEVARVLPGTLLQHVVVRDGAGRSLSYQVTNVAPEARDPHNLGLAYGELLFQHDFPAGEKTAMFTVERSEAVAPVFPPQAFARFVPERLDDFAWENDKIGHRTYGPALARPDDGKTGKEVLVTSGLDLWCKRVSYPIVDRWYNKGHNHYHADEGEGMDLYSVSTSRGCGGTGIWDGHTLAVSGNYQAWKILANGPVRAVFELTYAAWDAHGRRVTETKRITVDAGHQLDQIESTFTVADGGDPALVVAVGLNKTPASKDQDARIVLTPVAADGSLAQWIEMKTNGALGTALIVPSDACAGYAEDDKNQLMLAKATSGRPLRYFAGAGWSKAGEFTTPQAWHDYVAACAARARYPVTVTVAP